MGGKSWKVDTSYDDVYDNNAFEMDRVQYFKIAGAKRGIGTRCDLQWNDKVGGTPWIENLS